MTSEPREPQLIVRPHPGDPTGVRVELVADEHNGPVFLDFGDATDRERTKPGRAPVQHSYPGAGCYMITAAGKNGASIARQQVVVRDELHVPGVEVRTDPDTIRVLFSEVTDASGVLPHYRVEWPDGEHETAWGVPGTTVQHDAMPGRHEMRIVDTTSGRASVYPIEVPHRPKHDPDFTVGHDSADPTGMTIVLRLDAARDAPLHVWWDDADGPQVVESPTVGMEIPHRYRHPGHYMQTVAYAGSFGLDYSKSASASVPVRQPESRPRDEHEPYPDREVQTPRPEVDSSPRVPSDDPDRDVAGRRPVDIGTPGGADLAAPAEQPTPTPVAAYHHERQADTAGPVDGYPYDDPEPAPVIRD